MKGHFHAVPVGLVPLNGQTAAGSLTGENRFQAFSKQVELLFIGLVRPSCRDLCREGMRRDPCRRRDPHKAVCLAQPLFLQQRVVIIPVPIADSKDGGGAAAVQAVKDAALHVGQASGVNRRAEDDQIRFFKKIFLFPVLGTGKIDHLIMIAEPSCDSLHIALRALRRAEKYGVNPFCFHIVSSPFAPFPL